MLRARNGGDLISGGGKDEGPQRLDPMGRCFDGTAERGGRHISHIVVPFRLAPGPALLFVEHREQFALQEFGIEAGLVVGLTTARGRSTP